MAQAVPQWLLCQMEGLFFDNSYRVFLYNRVTSLKLGSTLFNCTRYSCLPSFYKHLVEAWRKLQGGIMADRYLALGVECMPLWRWYWCPPSLPIMLDLVSSGNHIALPNSNRSTANFTGQRRGTNLVLLLWTGQSLIWTRSRTEFCTVHCSWSAVLAIRSSIPDATVVPRKTRWLISFKCSVVQFLINWVYFHLLSMDKSIVPFTVTEVLFSLPPACHSCIPKIVIWMLHVMKHCIWLAWNNFSF